MDKNTITFTYRDKEYTLEYTLRTAGYAEDDGLKVSELGDKPARMIPLLFYWAFYRHHKGISRKQTQDIYSEMNHKNELVKALAEMYSNAVNALVDDDEDEADEGNANWTLN